MGRHSGGLSQATTAIQGVCELVEGRQAWAFTAPSRVAHPSSARRAGGGTTERAERRRLGESLPPIRPAYTAGPLPRPSVAAAFSPAAAGRTVLRATCNRLDTSPAKAPAV